MSRFPVSSRPMHDSERVKRIRSAFEAELASSFKLRDRFKNDPGKHKARLLADAVEAQKRNFEESLKNSSSAESEISTLAVAESFLSGHAIQRRSIEALSKEWESDAMGMG